MIRPSLTFISVSLILILSGCSSVPIINDLSVKGGHENSYTNQMIDGYEEISKELKDEIVFILEEIFFYNRIDEANLEKVNAFIQNGQIKDYYANQIQLITLNKKKLRSVPLINANFDTGKKNKEYIIESVLRRSNKFNITFDSKGRNISDGLLDSNLLFFCSSYLQDQKDIIEDHIFKKNNPSEVIVVFTKSYEEYAINLKQNFPGIKFSLINDKNHEEYAQKTLGIDRSLIRFNKIQKLDQNIVLENTPRERKDFKKVYFLVDYAIGKSIVPIFRSYLLNSDFYATNNILLGAINTKQLSDFDNLYIPTPQYFYKKVAQKQSIISIGDEINKALIDDMLRIEELNASNASDSFILLNSGAINYQNDKCIERELSFWKITQENLTSPL